MTEWVLEYVTEWVLGDGSTYVGRTVAAYHLVGRTEVPAIDVA